MPCPRCGEMFAIRSETEDLQPVEEAPVETTGAPPSRPPVANRTIAIGILAVMAAMAIFTLFYALQSESERRAHDTQIGKPEALSVPLFLKVAANLWIAGLVVLLLSIWAGRRRAASGGVLSTPQWRAAMGVAMILLAIGTTVSLFSEPLRRRNTAGTGDQASTLVRTVAPLQLEGWRYMPADCEVIAGINAKQVLEEKPIKNVLETLRIGPVNLSEQGVEKLTGLRWGAIDHVLFGLRIDVLRPTLVVRSREIINVNNITTALKATRIPESTHKDRYRFRFGGSAFEPVLWLTPDGHTIVFAMTPKDLDGIVKQSESPSIRLAGPLQKLFDERIGKSTPIWLAGHSDHWDQTLLRLWLDKLSPEEQKALYGIRSFGLWIDAVDDVAMQAAAECADDGAAERLLAFLQLKSKEALPKAHFVRNNATVSGQWHISESVLTELLRGPEKKD